MGRRKKSESLILLPSGATPSIEAAAELVERACLAHRERRHHLASTYLRAAQTMLIRLRTVARGPATILRTPIALRREVVKAVMELEPRPWQSVSIALVRDLVVGRIGVEPADVDSAFRELERRLVLTLRPSDSHDAAGGLWINGRGVLLVVSRARHYWADTCGPYID